MIISEKLETIGLMKKDLFADEFNKTMEFVSDNFERGFQKDDRNHTPEYVLRHFQLELT